MHELFWGNKILKTIDMSFTPLADMTPEAWAILDYGSLRPVAMNRIAEMAAAGRLVGFYDVKIIAKAKSKGNYMQPADDALIAEYPNGDNSVFGNEADGEVAESDIAITIDKIALSVSLWGAASVGVFIGLLIKFAKNKQDILLNNEELANELSDAEMQLEVELAKLKDAVENATKNEIEVRIKKLKAKIKELITKIEIDAQAGDLIAVENDLNKLMGMINNLYKLKSAQDLHWNPYDYALASILMALRGMLIDDVQALSDVLDEMDS